MSLSQLSPRGPRPQQWKDAYWREFRRRVFFLVQVGYRRLEAARFQAAHEEVITGELHRKIKDYLDADAPEWADSYTVHDDPPVHAEGRKGKHRRRLDLRFERLGARPRPHYEIECKRLCKGKSGAADYFGADGMALFLVGAYARQWPEAGMIGYVQTGDVCEWQEKLATKLAKQDVPQLSDGGWRSVTLVDGLATYATTHPRDADQAPIRVFHALLSLQSE